MVDSVEGAEDFELILVREREDLLDELVEDVRSERRLACSGEGDFDESPPWPYMSMELPMAWWPGILPGATAAGATAMVLDVLLEMVLGVAVEGVWLHGAAAAGSTMRLWGAAAVMGILDVFS